MKKIILIIFIIIVLLVLSFIGFIKYNKNIQQIAVLSYHNIIPNDSKKNENDNDTLTIAEFEEQIKYLKENDYKTISAKELYEWKKGETEIPQKSVLITFDDGYYSFKYLVEPILVKYDMKAICFLIGDSTFDKTPEYDPNTYGTIGKDEIQNHIENVEYGSHTYGMHYLTDDGEKLVRTLSKGELKEDVDKFDNTVFKAEYLAYPYYTFTKDFIEVLKEYNYKLAFAGEEEMATRKVDNYKIPRISGVKSIEEFKEIFETDKYKNKYGNGLIRKICVNIERRINK